MPKAVNTVVLRIGIFYVGSVLLLSMLLPFTAYKAGESPFVTFFSHMGSRRPEQSASIMNFVVLTAALSSLNAGLYSTGRILRSMAVNGSAPAFTAKMSRHGVPYGGILLTAVITLIGVGLNAHCRRRSSRSCWRYRPWESSADGEPSCSATSNLQKWVKQGKVAASIVSALRCTLHVLSHARASSPSSW